MLLIFFEGDTILNELPILLYPKHAQKVLGVGPTKFYELVKLSDFPKPRNPLGKRPMYLRKEIEDWASSLSMVEHND
jgi:predicted DNA-binding transcriptional regulator AlpA